MILVWWLVSSILGLLALPLVYRIFGRLPDRGYAFARPLGLMASSYVLWLGASFGLIPNNLGGALGALLITGGVALALGQRTELRAWLRRERGLILSMEAVFAVSYLLWAFVRANNPEIQFTEKPMELAFLNGILRSETFPPLDPWLAGYGISYYYFGYVMIGQLTLLSGAASGVAFNLTSALWFAMVALGSYGLLYNLLVLKRGRVHLALPLLGPLFVLIAGNLEGILDVLHSQHLFWTDGSSALWSWLDIQQLTVPPTGEPSWIPQRFLWWWRASRVVHDVNLAGNSVEVIDEFPFFSFLLADNHPHVLAIPFGLAAVGFALQLFVRGQARTLHLRSSSISLSKVFDLARLVAGGILALVVLRVVLATTGAQPLSVLEAVQRGLVELLLMAAGISLLAILVLVLMGVLPVLLNRGQFAFGAWLFGGLAFLNTWDSPIYLVLLLAVLAWVYRDRPRFSLLTELGYTGLALGTAAIVLYLPWYPSFSSQLGGVLVNLLFPTRLQHFVVMFGVSFIPIALWIVRRLRSEREMLRADLIWKVGLGLPLALALGGLLLGLANFVALTRQPAGLESVLQGLGVSSEALQSGVRAVLSAALDRRLSSSWTALLLSFSVGAGVALLVRPISQRSSGGRGSEVGSFVVCLVIVAALLVLAPEFVYLRDLFGTRMNTVFKFYYAAWILWGVAAAYAAVELWPSEWSLGSALRVGAYLPLLLGLVYPALATYTKANHFAPANGLTLDGARYLAESRPADLEAIRWIDRQLPTGVIVEAVGGSYSEYGRVAAHTGMPSLINWGGHEVQWRGTAELQGSRQADVQRLYETSSWPEAAAILEQYGIDYVYVGPLETVTYVRLNEAKFAANMQLIYETSEVRIYTRGAPG